MTEKQDRRVKRTRNALKHSLIHLIREKGYDAVTIQDITDAANLGRTTFYLHYESKEALLLDHYADILEHLDLGRWSREELLSKSEATGLIEFMNLVSGSRSFYMEILNARDADRILEGMQVQMVKNLEESLNSAFPDKQSRLPLNIVCNYVVGAQLGLIKWWLTHRNEYSTRQLAHMIQRLQYAAIRDNYGI